MDKKYLNIKKSNCDTEIIFTHPFIQGRCKGKTVHMSQAISETTGITGIVDSKTSKELGCLRQY